MSIFVWGGVQAGGRLNHGQVNSRPNETQFRYTNTLGWVFDDDNTKTGHEIRLWNPLRSLNANRYAFALVLESGTVVAWGHLSKGARAPQARIDAGGGARALFSTDDSFAALLVDGTVAVWGAIEESTSPLPSGHKVATIFSTANTFAYLGLGRDDVFLHGNWGGTDDHDVGKVSEGDKIHITKEISKFLRDESNEGDENLDNARGKIVNVHAGPTALVIEFQDGSLFSFGIFREPRRVVAKGDPAEYRPSVEVRRRVYSINTQSAQVPQVFRKDGWHHIQENAAAVGFSTSSSERKIQSIVPGSGRFAVVMTDGSVFEFPPSSTLKPHQDFEHYPDRDPFYPAKEEYQEHIMSEPVWFLGEHGFAEIVCGRDCRTNCDIEVGCSADRGSPIQIPPTNLYTDQSCPRGYVGKDGECEICPNGTRAILKNEFDDPNQFCQHCMGGQSLGGKPAALSCEFCPEGQSLSEEGFRCETCSAGQYREDLQDPNCTQCPALHYLGFDDTAPRDTHDSIQDCIRCPSGQLTGRGSGQPKQTGADYCSVCKAGTKTINVATDDIRCAPCSDGMYQDQPKSIICKACPAGYKSASMNGSAYCEQCLPGTYSSAERQSLCLPCAENTFAKKAASSSCEQCPRGRTSPIGSSKCSGCPAGKHVTPEVSIGCTLGSAAECKHASIADDTFACTGCRPGKFTAGANAGINGEYDCLDCHKGFKQPKDANMTHDMRSKITDNQKKRKHLGK